jgi:nicotinic acid mononucleotide adenylyltransferase
MNLTPHPLSITVVSRNAIEFKQRLTATLNADWKLFESCESVSASMSSLRLPPEPRQLCRTLATWDFHDLRQDQKLASVGIIEIDSATIVAAIHNAELTAQLEVDFKDYDWPRQVQSLVELIDDSSCADVANALVAKDTQLQQLLDGNQNAVWKGRVTGRPGTLPPALMPGSFDPIHRGHREMLNVARQMLGTSIDLELSVANVDKPMLDHITVQQRVEQLPSELGVWLTRAPTFAQKAAIFPRSTFVVGSDTIARIADEKYCADALDRDRAIDAIASAGCQFLVFGRLMSDRFETADDISLPAELRKICESVSEHRFRVDVSSTELRSRD